MDASLLPAAAAAGFVYSITPGPGVLAVLGIGADRGRPAGAAFLAGHLVGDVGWATLALVAIIGASSVGSTLFDVLGVASGLYLFWLGIRAIRVRRGARLAPTTLGQPLLHGLVFGASNPKSYPVAVATLTALLSTKADLLTWEMLPALVAASIVGGACAYALLVAFVGVGAVRRGYRRHEAAITRVSGVMFVGFAVSALAHAVPGLVGARRP